MKRGQAAATAALLVISVLLTLVIIEGGYRFFLWSDLKAESEKFYMPQPNPSLQFYGWPPPWRFHREFGFSFNDGPWLNGRVVNGAFDSCNTNSRGNRYGNFGPLRGEYEKAELKIAIFGSSFTLIDHGGRGDTTTNLLQEALSKRLGRSVHILNFSRDATGFLSMFDIARVAAKEFKPDLMLFTFNLSALGYRRHWRVVKETRSPFSVMHFNSDPTEDPLPARSIMHPNPITRQVTAQWCAEMARAKALGDKGRLVGDPLLKAITAEYIQIMRQRTVPNISIDFTGVFVSFALNRIFHGDPFHGVRKFSEKSVWVPIDFDSFQSDAQFVAAVDAIKASRIPFQLIHLPTLAELRRTSSYPTGQTGLGDTREASLLKSVIDTTGKEVIHLVDYYPSSRLQDPIRLVSSETDSHPSESGVTAMAEALEDLLVRLRLVPGVKR